MAQSSRFWTSGSIGDGAAPYTQDNLSAWLQKTLIVDPTTQCVLYGSGNGLAITGTSSPVSMNTGAGYVDGIFYENTAAVTQAIDTPSTGTTGHRLILRADWTARTVRLALLSSADGTAAIPAVTQTPGATYEVSLYTATITTGGVITLVDDRHYLHPNLMVSTGMVDAAITAVLIPTGGKFIGIFNEACPSGWTRVSAFDNLFIRGGATYGVATGADAHVHTGPSHTHAGPSHTHTGPSHTHAQVSTVGGARVLGGWIMIDGDNTLKNSTADGAGSSTYAYGGVVAGGTGATGASGTAATAAGGDGNTGSTSNVPANITVIFCSKD